MNGSVPLIALLLATATYSQQKKTTAPPLANPTGYAISPMVLKDEGCARDYLKAMAATGVAMRKQIAELVLYGCAEKTTGFFRGVSLERKRLPATAATMHRVTMVCATACGGAMFLKGWILGPDFNAASEDAIKVIERAAEQELARKAQ